MNPKEYNVVPYLKQEYGVFRRIPEKAISYTSKYLNNFIAVIRLQCNKFALHSRNTYLCTSLSVSLLFHLKL